MQLILASGTYTKPITFQYLLQGISELQHKLSSEITKEEGENTTVSVVEPAMSGKKQSGLSTSASITKEIARPADSSGAFYSVPSSKALIAEVPHVMLPAGNSGGENKMSEKKRLNKDSGSDGRCEGVGVRMCGEGDEDGGADVTGTEEWRELSSTEEGGELKAALAQLEEEKKRWEVELANQQKEREVSEWG